MPARARAYFSIWGLAAALWLAAMLVLPSAAAANPAFDADRAAVRAEMGKLAALKGEWRGEGWIDIPSRGRVPFVSEETVEERLGGSALLVEGRHHDPKTRRGYHHALGMLTYDPARKRYRMATALDHGRGGVFPAFLEDDRLTWHIEPPRGPRVRYVITFSPDSWLEVGERSTDGGTWTPFFEMRLKRVK